MLISVCEALGGLGIFLMGMIILTDGLKSLTGNRIHKALLRFTHNPSSGALFGTISTAILQSSSATTVAAVGFVRAGLISFPEALGIIFGANIGTTITGWLVALLGFKLKLGLILMPMVFIGAALKLFCKKSLANIGFALAGFGLIFIGISTLQESLQSLHHVISFENFPSDNMTGRLQLVFIGIVFTLITQSSSLGVATTLTVLNANMMSFEQAMALVIGIDVGTTVTAVIATLGGTAATKRTGWSHVTYNLITATIAFFLITPFIYAINSIQLGFIETHGEIGLVAFHSFFNLLGVLSILPFTHQFAKFMEWIIPDQSAHQNYTLDKLLLKDPAMAISEANRAYRYHLDKSLNYMINLLEQPNHEHELESHQKNLQELQTYLNKIKLDNVESIHFKPYLSLTHGLDHLDRLLDRLEENDRIKQLFQLGPLENFTEIYKNSVVLVQKNLKGRNFASALKTANQLADFTQENKQKYRNLIMSQKAQAILNEEQAQISLEAIRWSIRSSHHLSRICFYLEEMALKEAQMP